MKEKTVLKLKKAIAGYSNKSKKIEIVKIEEISAKKGEIIALIGINGSGKSTVLKSIVGMQKFINGDVSLKNINLNKYSSKQIAKIISFVSSEIITTNHLTVFDLVSLGRYPHTSAGGKLHTNDIKIIEKAIETVGLQKLISSDINEISDGERQRTMIARALAQDTEIIILDEPASFLDIQNKYSVYGIMHKLAEEQNKTVIFSTHDISIALKFSDKFWLIHKKNIVENSPEDIINSGFLNKLFDNDKIIFDIKTLDYKFSQKLNKAIKIEDNTNNKDISLLTENALKRNGFFVDENCKETILQISCNDKMPIFTIKKQKFYSFYDMISTLKKYNIT